jgi:hypothetical protein
MMTNMDTMAGFTKTEYIRFNMVPPLARETGTLDALSITRGSVSEDIYAGLPPGRDGAA